MFKTLFDNIDNVYYIWINFKKRTMSKTKNYILRIKDENFYNRFKAACSLVGKDMSVVFRELMERFIKETLK